MIRQIMLRCDLIRIWKGGVGYGSSSWRQGWRGGEEASKFKDGQEREICCGQDAC